MHKEMLALSNFCKQHQSAGPHEGAYAQAFKDRRAGARAYMYTNYTNAHIH